MKTELRSGILLIEIDNPPVNALSQAIRGGLMAALRQGWADPDVEGMAIIGAGKTFIGGADIREFGQPAAAPFLPDVVSAIEDSPKPVVAALNGAALGGGLEVALAAHRRIALPIATLGLPEVKLGLIPGAGGTQRLPRLTGAAVAIDLITSGRSITATEAENLGILDKIVEGDLSAAAIAEARSLIGTLFPRTGDRTVPSSETGPDLRRPSRAQQEAARLVLLAAGHSLRDGLAEERAAFVRLRDSEESAALRHVFFAERASAKIESLDQIRVREISTLGIVGIGLMGSGIAVAALNAGLAVIAVEPNAADAQERIIGLLDRAIRSGRLDEAGKRQRLARLTMSSEIAAVSAADFVIEAVIDDFAVKSKLFSDLDGILRPGAILASNTSYLDLDALAAVSRLPARVVGLHFFSPAHVMRLVEVVRGKATAPEALASAFGLAKRLGKLPIVCGATEGFIGNRIFSAYRREAEFLLEDGVLPHEIDQAMEEYGFAMGPFAVFDLAGLEIAWARRKRQAATRDPAERYVEIADRLCESGRLGQKTGGGWYRYDSGSKQIDPDVTAIVEAARAAKGIEPRQLEAEEIVTRLLAAMAKEGAALLAEGIAARTSDIDLVMIHGYGFPAGKGGPMYAQLHMKEDHRRGVR